MRCTTCEDDKAEADFDFRNEATGERRNQCKLCVRRYSHQHYLDNKSAYIERGKMAKRRARARNTNFLIAYLAGHPCVDCGESDIVVLDFDHVRGEKVENVSDMVRKCRSIDSMRAEISKCDVRCANCHRRRTAGRGGWAKLLLSA